MEKIIDQTRVYEGIIVGYVPKKEKTDKFGKAFTANPVAFIWPKDTSLQLMMTAYRQLAGKTCKNPENISATIPLPGQGERRWTKGNAHITEADCGKHVSFSVTEPDKQGLPQAINTVIIDPEETIADDIREEAAEEARLELAEQTKTEPVTVAPVDTLGKNALAAYTQEMLTEDDLEDEETESDEDDRDFDQEETDFGDLYEN